MPDPFAAAFVCGAGLCLVYLVLHSNGPVAATPATAPALTGPGWTHLYDAPGADEARV